MMHGILIKSQVFMLLCSAKITQVKPRVKQRFNKTASG